MPAFWIIVQRGQRELLAALAAAFQNRPGFTVIEDRRRGPTRGRRDDRRRAEAGSWTEGGFLLVEREDFFG